MFTHAHLEAVMNTVRRNFVLVSPNLKTINFQRDRDDITVIPSLLERRDKNRALNALIIQDIDSVAGNSLNTMRNKNLSDLVVEDELMGTNASLLLMAQIANERGVGNCSEMALFAFFALMKAGFPGNIEYAMFENYEHWFLILDRDGKATNDPKRWNKNTLIFDPWLNLIFPASEMEAVWKDKLHLLIKKPTELHDIKERPTLNDLLKTEIQFDSQSLSAKFKKIVDQQEIKNILKSLSPNDAYIFIQTYASIYGNEFVRKQLINEEIILNILEGAAPATATEFIANFCKDAFKAKYDAGTATPIQIFCYGLTASDGNSIKIDDLLHAYKENSQTSLSTSHPKLFQSIYSLVILRAIVDNDSLDAFQKAKSIVETIAKFPKVQFINYNGINFNNLDFRKLPLTHIKFPHANLNGCNFNESNISDASFYKAKLVGANLSEVVAKNTDLRFADLSRANLENADLEGCNLTGTILINAKLTGVNFKNANLTGAIFIPKDAFKTPTSLMNALFNLYDEIQGSPHYEKLCQAIAGNIATMVKNISKKDPRLANELIEVALEHGLFKHAEKNKTPARLETNGLFKQPKPSETESLKILQKCQILISYRPHARTTQNIGKR